MVKKTRYALLAFLIASLSLPSLAQPGPGRGHGPGFRFNQGNTPGWTLMTAQERDAHRARMLSFKTYDECKAYQDEHHQLMEERAKEKGKALPATRNNACDTMKSRGILK